MYGVLNEKVITINCQDKILNNECLIRDSLLTLKSEGFKFYICTQLYIKIIMYLIILIQYIPFQTLQFIMHVYTHAPENKIFPLSIFTGQPVSLEIKIFKQKWVTCT